MMLTTRHLNVREEGGEGRLLLFTHGIGDTSATWDAQVEHSMPQGQTVVTWDLRGHGRSDAPADPAYYSRTNALSDMDAILDGRKAILVGHSLGGYFSMAYAIIHPDQVDGLILIASGPGFRNPARRDKWNSLALGAVQSVGLNDGVVGLLMQEDSFVIDHLGDIRAPVLQVVGSRDHRFLRTQPILEGKAKGPVNSAVIANAGHMVHRRQAEEVNTAIDGFLNALDGGELLLEHSRQRMQERQRRSGSLSSRHSGRKPT
jgi:pimeloyl-ACP methyl ester carboxylesterase